MMLSPQHLELEITRGLLIYRLNIIQDLIMVLRFTIWPT